MLRSKWLFVILMLVTVYIAVPFQAQGAPPKYDPAKFITKMQLKERGYIKIDVHGVGEFEILNLALNSNRRSNCAVELKSLKRLVRKAASKDNDGGLSPGSKVTISMDKTGCIGPNGEILLCCMNEGTACTVTLGVKQVYIDQNVGTGGIR